MAIDLLVSLKRQLADQQAIATEASRVASDLQTAIDAIEAKHRDETRAASDQPRETVQKRRRGDLMRVGLDCIRQGKGRHHQIKEACIDQNVEITENSISNLLQRLQSKRMITYCVEEKRYVLRESGDPHAQLKKDLEESVRTLEGSKVVPLKPSVSNGASVSIGREAAMQTAST